MTKANNMIDDSILVIHELIKIAQPVHETDKLLLYPDMKKGYSPTACITGTGTWKKWKQILKN